MPITFEKFFKMEQSRLARVKFLQEQLVEGLRHVFPIINTCYDNILAAGKEIHSDKDLKQLVEQKKTGFPIPDDRFFTEYGTNAAPSLQLGTVSSLRNVQKLEPRSYKFSLHHKGFLGAKPQKIQNITQFTLFYL